MAMKKLSFALLLCLYVLHTHAQPDSIYQALIAKAGLLHLQKNYRAAITEYDKAFKIQKPDALTAYKAAGVYALDSNAPKAFYYLKIALQKGWTEADWLSADPYFNYLRKTAPADWEKIVRESVSKEQQYARTLQLSSLRKEINQMMLADQQLRYKKVQAKNDSLLKSINRQIMQADANNQQRAKEIIRQYGWPTMLQIGKDGQNNLWLVVQHADNDVLFQQATLYEMEKWKGTTQLNHENYAFLYDRVKCNLNYKQLYGTQVIWAQNGQASGFRPVTEEANVNERRKAMGLQPLQIYALTYGMEYHTITAAQQQQRDVAEQAYVHSLIDSARYFYQQKDFQKTYDYYNTASTFLGGMSNEDNFKAAVIFSNIAAVNQDEQYKSIALDFLELLFMRKYLTRALLEQSAFTILHNEKRWISINKLL